MSRVVAALVFTKFREQILAPLQSNMGVKSAFLDKEMGVEYYLVSLPLAFLFLMVIVVLEYLVPWYTEYPVDQNDVFPSITAVAWPPYFSGMMIGLLQIPLVFAFDKALGCSTGFERIAGFIHSKVGTASSPFIDQISSVEAGNLWQMCFLFGATFGAFISSFASSSFASAASLPLAHSFIGGFLIIMGARIAGGCTSGHGITGFSKLSLASFIAVPVMFASGTAVVLVFGL